MANSIALFKKYVPLLDEVYKQASKTSILDGNPELAREGASANELVIPMLDMNGLGDYSRNSGYVNGDVTLTNQTIGVDYDRGRMFSVDAMDNAESAGLAFGRLAGEFIRTKVVPELDAYRMARYASMSGISKVTSGATLSTGADVLAALRAAAGKMDQDEVPEEGRILFINSALVDLVDDLDTTKSKAVMARFAQTVRMPGSRMYTKITMRDGSSTGETAGGFVRYGTHYEECESTDTGALHVVADATASPSSTEIKVGAVTPLVDATYTPATGDYVRAVVDKDINFLVIHREAVIQFPKHIAPKVVTPEQNQSADAWKFGYRQVGVNSLYHNKLAGVYLHHKA